MSVDVCPYVVDVVEGLVLDDSGMRHEDDEGRIWEVEDHFDELTWW